MIVFGVEIKKSPLNDEALDICQKVHQPNGGLIFISEQ